METQTAICHKCHPEVTHDVWQQSISRSLSPSSIPGIIEPAKNGPSSSSCPASFGKLCSSPLWFISALDPLLSWVSIILRLYLEFYHVLPVADVKFREGRHSIHHFKTRMETSFRDQTCSMTLLGIMSSSSTLVVTHRI